MAKNGDTTFVRTFRNGLRQIFSADGKIAAITDRFGNTLVFSYTGNDFTGIGDPAGRVISLAYATDVTPHRLIAVTDPNGRTYDLMYQNGRLWRVVYPLADESATARGYWEYTYFDNGSLKTKRDPEGNFYQLTYYPDGRIMSSVDPEGVSDPDGHTRTLTYGPSGDGTATSTFREKDGGEWLYTIDTRTGVLLSRTDPDGRITRYTHTPDPGLEVESVTVPYDGGKSLSTFFLYDDYGNIIRQTEPVDLAEYGITDPASVIVSMIGTPFSPLKWAFAATYDTAIGSRITSVSDLRVSPARITSYAYTMENGGEVG